MMDVKLMQGDCLDKMRAMPSKSVDSIVTDPPYGLGFMGKKWDIGVPAVEVFAECLRILRPGGHLLAFGGSRTYHRLAVAVEDAGFEIRDQIMWVYGSGFPKSQNVSKAMDKAAGAEREVIGVSSKTGDRKSAFAAQRNDSESGFYGEAKTNYLTAPATDAARQWDGWGTALKPAHEPIVVARKPFAGTVAANVLDHGTGALNIDGCRIETTVNLNGGAYANDPTERESMRGEEAGNSWRRGGAGGYQQPEGRWPANLIHDGSQEVVGLFPVTKSGSLNAGHKRGSGVTSYDGGGGVVMRDYGNDKGSAARFFYSAKASKKDRGEGNTHPTVKPCDLMRYLCRLVTPPGGTVLDPFLGSGSTGKAAVMEGFAFIGIELDPGYFEIAERRIAEAIT